MERLAVQDPLLIVLAAGETPSAVNNQRGHLFEKFIGHLLKEYGYDAPSESNFNITAEGIEIDVVAVNSLSGHTAIAEGKAYASKVKARVVTSFYGALTLHRFDHPDADGYLFVTPSLVPEGEEQARKAESQDSRFHYLNALTIVRHLKERHLLAGSPDGDAPTSDPAVLITEEGIYGALKILDETTRLARKVVVWGKNGNLVPAPVLELLSENDYALGLKLDDLAHSGKIAMTPAASSHSDPAPIVVPVQGSNSDFDPFPASPKNFVGRTVYVTALNTFVERGQGVFVLNAHSGWGKSSLALRSKQLVERVGGYGAVLDSRTASSPRYVTEVLRKIALEADASGLIALPHDSSWASLSSAITSLERSRWLRDAPLMIFFDQFENVFQQAATTRAFRDLALRVADSSAKILIGFAWKTDMVSWTEDHPYRFRDEIRGAGNQLVLLPMGPRDVELLLRRLEKQIPGKLHRDLRQRLSEYSQGFPWLFKKLAGHVINEIGQGRSQEQLVSEALNVESLFKADMAGLSPVETDALKHVARFAPISAVEVTERFNAGIVQSLLDSRLAVAVGDKLDTYWDIFREFVMTGEVPIQEGYIVRQVPSSVARLMAELTSRGGDANVSDLAKALHTSESAIFNLSRELRLFGLTSYEPNRVKLLPEIIASTDPEAMIRSRVSSALKRHRAYSLLTRLAERFSTQGIPIDAFSQDVQRAFAAVDAKPRTWYVYARAFVLWFEYVGLATLDGRVIRLAEDVTEGRGELLGPALPRRGSVEGIHMSPGPVLALLRRAMDEDVFLENLTRKERRGISILVAMRLLSIPSSGLLTPLDMTNGLTPEHIRLGMERMPGVRLALAELAREPSADAKTLGAIVKDATGANWGEATVAIMGKHLRSWARQAGLTLSYGRSRQPSVLRSHDDQSVTDDLKLFD